MATQHPTEPSRLELLRNRFPGWRIDRAPGRLIGYVADRGDEHLWGAHIGALEAKLADAEGGHGD
jgi:hypothetical protein